MRTPGSRAAVRISELADGVHFVEGRDANWSIIRDGKRFSLVDTGFPGYIQDVYDSIAAVGLSLSGLEAILITHPHIDHCGAVPAILEHRQVPVYVGAHDVGTARGDESDSVTTGQVLRRLAHRGMLSWTLRISRAKGARSVPISSPQGLSGGMVNAPGKPRAVNTPGHTRGHLMYHLAEPRVLITGDALCTGHALTPWSGPQLLPRMFHHDPSRALEQLDAVGELDAQVLLPGHGGAWWGSTRDAVALAAQRGIPNP